jgi:deoxyribodipyrimidine photo-lyase
MIGFCFLTYDDIERTDIWKKFFKNIDKRFLETLLDADLASNSASWQWVAGCGADASPYFRIFNPVLQGEKFDPQGAFIQHWLPELASLGAKEIHNPSPISRKALAYPLQIVDLKTSRVRAIEAFKDLR